MGAQMKVPNRRANDLSFRDTRKNYTEGAHKVNSQMVMKLDKPWNDTFV